ncbi:MAG: AAA family ATPase [Oscillospiraceae bacterium]
MQFFKLVGAFAAGSGGQGRKRTADENVDLLAAKSEAFNKGLRGRVFFYVVNASGGTFTAMAVQKDSRMNMNPQFPAYTEALGVKLTDIHAEEISLHAACNLLHRASRSDYIEDDDDVLEALDLDYMINRRFSDFCFREDLIDEACRDEIYARAGRLFTKDCLLPELDRIYAGGSFGKIVGHPVHYLIQTDDAGIRQEMIQALLPSLYANGRLQNRRYSSVRFRGEALHGESSAYDQFYKSNAGGTVIVQYSADYDDIDDEDTADGIRDTIEKLCSYIKKYRHQVLTILCLPRECTKLKELFYEDLGTVSFVELKEEFLEGEQAGDYLKLLARDNHVRTDKKLFAKLEGNRGYLAPELRTIFDGWYNNKLKTTVYPQYKEITTVKTEVEKAKPKGDAYKELMEMIGLTEAKKVILQALNYHKAQKLFADKGMKVDHPAMHMVFTGNPGTAKTTVARLFARIMRENGLLSRGHLVEVGRGDLVGKYVGWTAQTVQKRFEQAEGGVLFIDEAYSLVDGRSGSYGDEAINTIVQEMENYRDDMVVIFAGYPDRMEEFLQKNPGLRSRIAYHVPFADYSVEELCSIATLTARKKGLHLDDQAQEKLASVFETARRQGDFGNGRYVRNILEKAKMAQATRLLTQDYESLTQKEITTLCAEDIEMPEIAAPARPRIGFSA